MNHSKYEVLNTMIIGASTTFAHDFFITPADLIKQRLQLCKNLNTKTTIQKVILDSGVMGLWRSYPLTVFMNIPYASIVVTVNENMKTLIKPWERENPHLWYFVCAGIAGGFAGMFTNPLDVVKTRLQTEEVQPSCAKLVKLWKREVELLKETEHMGKKQAQEFRETHTKAEITDTSRVG